MSVKTALAQDSLASLQRGAAYFINYCAGCHSLKYMRYERLAQDLNLMEHGKISKQIVQDNLIFTETTLNQPIAVSLRLEDAQRWFGKQPPDLSLITRARSKEWVYNYLLNFYPDTARPFGVNNDLLKNTTMPDVFCAIRDSSDHVSTIVSDLVSFLDYVSEPYKRHRQHLGLWVHVFLGVLLILVFFLRLRIWQGAMHRRFYDRRDP